jgi:hypothetical protein
MPTLTRKAVLALLAMPLLLHAWSATAAAPALEVQLADTKAMPNVPFPVQYIVRWEGAPDEWAILPPRVDPPDWGTAELHSVQSTHADGVSTVTFEVLYTPEQPGTHRLPELAFFYDPPSELSGPAENAEETGSGAALLAERQEIQVSPPPPRWLIPAVSVAVLLSLAVILFFVQRQRRPKQRPKAGTSPLDQMQEALHTARRRRLDGDLYAYYRELVRAAEFISDDAEAKQLLEKFRTRTQEVGYKGMRPSDDILEGDMRDVERLLARRKEEFGA